jgi:membrane-associated protein
LAPTTDSLSGVFLDPQQLLVTFGTIGLFLIVFAESGLLIGFFLPGDSLLFTAGLFAAQGTLNLPLILVGCFIAAVAGDQVGYAFGKRVGPALFRRPNSRFFKQEYLEKAQSFFERHGAKTIVLARFVPIVRTFAPIVAGAGTMRYRTFAIYNVIGGLLWAMGVTLLGYLLGELIPDIDTYLLPIIAGIVLLSVIPIGLEWRKARKRQALTTDQ